MKKATTGYFKSYDKDADLVRFVASSDSVDREGESLPTSGWILDNFMKNPVLLWSHNDRELPVGKVVSVFTEENRLVADVQFAEKENDFAKKVADLVKGGFLNAVSVGFMPTKYDAEGKTIEQELLELSIVNVPANQDALRSNMYQSFVKSLDMDEKNAQKKAEEKSPACRMDGEDKDACVSRKIPEIKKENPNMSQEQCVAMAESMCSKACNEKEKKEGRIISEKNRNTMRIAIESMKQATESLGDLLNATEPPAKKGGAPVKEPLNGSQKRVYKAIQLMDKVVEAAIHELKGGGENNG